MKNSTKVLIGFLVGTASGVAAGFYLNSEEGRQKRKGLSKDLAQMEKRLEANMREQYDQLSNKYDELSEKGKTKLAELKEKSKNQYDELSEKGKTKLAELKEKSKTQLDELSSKAKESSGQAKTKLSSAAEIAAKKVKAPKTFKKGEKIAVSTEKKTNETVEKVKNTLQRGMDKAKSRTTRKSNDLDGTIA